MSTGRGQGMSHVFPNTREREVGTQGVGSLRWILRPLDDSWATGNRLKRASAFRRHESSAMNIEFPFHRPLECDPALRKEAFLYLSSSLRAPRKPASCPRRLPTYRSRVSAPAAFKRPRSARRSASLAFIRRECHCFDSTNVLKTLGG